MSDLCLSPRPLSGDFTLSCPVGDILIKKNEHDYYTSLFYALDSDDDGRIRYKDSLLFLQRSGVSEASLLLVWDDVCIYKDADIVLEQWLLLCKILAYAKKYSNFCAKPSLADVVSDTEVDALDMFLDKLVDKYDHVPPPASDLWAERCPLDIDVISWENVVGSSIELGSSYSLYNIRYTTTLPHFSRKEWDAHRRFSDFAFLVEVLERRYRGVFIPPLPPKYEHLLDTGYHASSNKTDRLAQGRANDLSIFLKYLARHPILSLSLEFMVFLQASSSGFASYRRALKIVMDMHQKHVSVLSTSVDDMVLMALSTTTAVTGFASSMLGAVNGFLGLSEPILGPAGDLGAHMDLSDVRVSSKFSHDFEKMLYCARATQKASIKLDELIHIDKKRVFDMDRISHFFEKCGKLPHNKASFNATVGKFAKEYDGISTQLCSNLELQKIEVSNQLLNLGRFYHVMQKNLETREADMARLADKKSEVISYGKQLQRARTMSSIKPVVLDRLEASIEQATDAFEDMKVDIKKSFEATERDISWLGALLRFELQGRVLGFVQMRAAACQAEAESLSKLYVDIEENL